MADFKGGDLVSLRADLPGRATISRTITFDKVSTPLDTIQGLGLEDYRV